MSWPGPPVYIFAFLCFFFSLIRSPQKLIIFDSRRNAGIYFLIFLAILSNIVALPSTYLDFTRVITTIFFFILLTFDEMVDDRRALLDGFSMSMYILAILVLVYSIYLRVFDNGLLLFSVPEYRLWGSDYFPDWPNYLAFMLSLAFMLNMLVFGRSVVAVVQLTAALLTTSRTPFLALGLCIFAVFFSVRKGHSCKKWYLVGLIAVSLGTLFFSANVVDEDLLARMLIFEDRDAIYRFAMNLVFDSPIIGNGSILLDESVGFTGFPSFHNSYLDVSVRHGVPALIVFLLILMPDSKNKKTGGVAFFAMISFFIIGSVFQNFLKHPHIIMVYMVCVNSAYLFKKNES